MEIKEKVLTVKLPGESHRRLKVLASSEGLSIKGFLMSLVNDIYTRKFKNEDKEWNKFIKAHDNAPEEEPAPEDIEAIKRGKQEYARGEYQDFDEMVKELDNESNSDEIGKERLKKT
jgi:predicted transcriptional regulator